MLDIGWSELVLIGIVALIVVGPKDLPRMFHALGRMTARLRGMAREFQGAMNDAAKASGLDEVRRDLQDIKTSTSAKALGIDALENAASKFEKWDPKSVMRPTLPATPPAGEFAGNPASAGAAFTGEQTPVPATPAPLTAPPVSQPSATEGALPSESATGTFLETPVAEKAAAEKPAKALAEPALGTAKAAPKKTAAKATAKAPVKNAVKTAEKPAAKAAVKPAKKAAVKAAVKAAGEPAAAAKPADKPAVKKAVKKAAAPKPAPDLAADPAPVQAPVQAPVAARTSEAAAGPAAGTVKRGGLRRKKGDA